MAGIIWVALGTALMLALMLTSDRIKNRRPVVVAVPVFDR
jgi:hypothetical protein